MAWLFKHNDIHAKLSEIFNFSIKKWFDSQSNSKLVIKPKQKSILIHDHGSQNFEHFNFYDHQCFIGFFMKTIDFLMSKNVWLFDFEIIKTNGFFYSPTR